MKIKITDLARGKELPADQKRTLRKKPKKKKVTIPIVEIPARPTKTPEIPTKPKKSVAKVAKAVKTKIVTQARKALAKKKGVK